MSNPPYVAPVLGIGDVEDSGDFFVYYVEYLSASSVRIWFSNEVVVGDNYNAAGNYSITSSEGELQVVAVVPASFEVMSYTTLHVRPMTEGQTYTVVVNSVITDRAGASLVTDEASWTYQRTKLDAMLTNIPKMYDKRPTSYLGQIAGAIAYADNLIGGSVSEIPED